MRKMSILSVLVLLCMAGPVMATVTLSLTPTDRTATVGSSVAVDMVIAGLGDFAAPSLSTFDVDVSYDATVLTYSGATFGDPVLGEQLDLFGFGAITSAFDVSGVVNVFELSLDLPDDLDGLQFSSFTLATLTFDVAGVGTSPLTMSVNALADSWGLPLDDVVVEASSITGITAIPAPGALMLASLGVSLLALRRKKHNF